MKTELAIAIRYWDVYSFLSLQDLKNRFRRSQLGLLWIVLQQLMFSLGAGLIWSRVFNIDAATFIPFLTVGFSIWGFIAAAMTESCSSFINAHGYLKQLPLPQSIFIFRTVLTNCLYLAVGLLTAIFVLLIFKKFSIISLLYALPGLCILILYFYGASGAMAYLGLRYRDLPHAMSSLFSLLFVLTPVIYPPEILAKKGFALVTYLNPFSSLIEIIRVPLLNYHFADAMYYFIALGFAVITVYLKFTLQKKWGRYVPFWS